MKSDRLIREERTISAILLLYCRHHHPPNIDTLCPDCESIREYAVKRLYACPFKENKPSCANCITHCYNSDMQGKVQTIMRYSGPRLTLRHPILAILHILDGRINASPLKKNINVNPNK